MTLFGRLGRGRFAAVLSLSVFVLFAASPTALADGVRAGLRLCAASLIPSVFPFVVSAGLFCALGGAEMLARVLAAPCRAIFGIGGEGSGVLFTAALCGFPIGAASAVRVYENGGVSRNELDRLMILTANPSPAFVISAVGAGMWGSGAFGLLLYASQLFSVLFVGVLVRGLYPDRESTPLAPPCTEKRARLSVEITETISRSALSMLNICSFAVAFSALINALLSHLGGVWASDISGAVLCGFFELTSASDAACRIGGANGAVMTAFFVGWSGLSALLQVTSVCAERNIETDIKRYFALKLLQGCVCAAFMLAAVKLLGASFPSGASETMAVSGEGNESTCILALVGCAIFAFAGKRKKSVGRK